MVEGEAPTLDAAKAKAEGDKIKSIANAVKQLATTPSLRLLKQGMLNSSTEMDGYFEESIAAVSRNVQISGGFPVGVYWEQFELIPERSGFQERISVCGKIRCRLQNLRNGKSERLG